ncbi:hypothetical protein BASA81_009088 [Batrachochytrium salamandrivorans]|nr:hypothetical protein BASA81_009088 [Batrachochytrium salamandrivorans]
MGQCSSLNPKAPRPHSNSSATRSFRKILLCDDTASLVTINPDLCNFKENLAKVNDLAEFELRYDYVKCNDQGSLLGSGITGQVRLVRSKQDGQVYAVKSLNVDQMDGAQLQELQIEIEMLRKLDHPNIITLMEVFQSKKNIMIVMEHCAGRDLGHRKFRSEREVCSIMFQLTEAISHCHHMGVIHRDLKFENVMLASDGCDSVRVIDFGLSKKFEVVEENIARLMQTACGTAFYMAPEMLTSSYSEKADIWALGVICYMIFQGRAPFEGQTEKEVFRKLKKGVVSFADPVWKSLSPEAVEFVKALLTVDPDLRPSAKEALESKWLVRFQKEKAIKMQKSDEGSAFAKDVCESMLRFGTYPKLKQVALIALAHHLKERDTRELRDLFLQLDEDHSGLLTYDELFSMICQHSEDVTPEYFRMVFDEIDNDHTGVVHHTEFLAATMESRVDLTAELVSQAFEDLDVGKQGRIKPGVLKSLLGGKHSLMEAKGMLDECRQCCGLLSDESELGMTKADFLIVMGHRPPSRPMTPRAPSPPAQLELSRVATVDEMKELQQEVAEHKEEDACSCCSHEDEHKVEEEEEDACSCCSHEAHLQPMAMTVTATTAVE